MSMWACCAVWGDEGLEAPGSTPRRAGACDAVNTLGGPHRGWKQGPRGLYSNTDESHHSREQSEWDLKHTVPLMGINKTINKTCIQNNNLYILQERTRTRRYSLSV